MEASKVQCPPWDFEEVAKELVRLYEAGQVDDATIIHMRHIGYALGITREALERIGLVIE